MLPEPVLRALESTGALEAYVVGVRLPHCREYRVIVTSLHDGSTCRTRDWETHHLCDIEAKFRRNLKRRFSILAPVVILVGCRGRAFKPRSLRHPVPVDIVCVFGAHVQDHSTAQAAGIRIDIPLGGGLCQDVENDVHVLALCCAGVPSDGFSEAHPGLEN
jgi:hypothetical protein